jgi:hypothetical protein
MFSVGWILESEGVLKDAADALHFCERPDKWISDVKNLIEEYEEKQ